MFDGGWKNFCNKESSCWSSIVTEALKELKARIEAKIQKTGLSQFVGLLNSQNSLFLLQSLL